MIKYDTSCGIQIEGMLLENYFRYLVNKFFKILPMREKEEASLREYIRGLQSEMAGCRDFVAVCGENPMFLSLLSILEYLAGDTQTEPLTVADVRREVFRSISICEKLSNQIKGE